MSCSNFKLANYPKFDAYLKNQFGEDLIGYTNLAGLVTDDFFNNIIINERINIEEEPERAYDALVRTKDKVFKTITEKSKETALADKGEFSSYEAKRQALDYCASIIANVKFNDTLKGITTPFDDIRKQLNIKVTNAMRGRAFRIKDKANDEKINKDYVKFNKLKGIEFYNGLINFIEKYGTNKDRNYIAIGKSLLITKDEGFIESLLTHKVVANLFKDKIEYQFTDEEELGGYVTETGQEMTENNLDSKEDAMAIHWNNNGGELSNYSKHVETVVRHHLSYVPKTLNANSRPDGKYDYDLSNELGTPSYIDFEFINKLLFSIADCSNVDNFIESVKYIAETIEGAEGLIIIYDYLKNNKSFAYKYMMVYNKPIVRKVEVYLDETNADPNNSQKSLNARITNTAASRKGIILSNLFNTVKSAMTSTAVDDAIMQLNAYGNKIITVEGANQRLYEIANILYPDITRGAIDKIIEEIGLEQTLANIEALKNIMIDTRDAYNEFNAKIAAGQKLEIPNSFIPEGDTGIIYAWANMLQNKLNIGIDLNSRNVEGNMTSDVLNPNYATIIDNIIHGVYGEQAINSFIKQKFASNQYEYSNILLEHSENDKIINYGIFRKNNQGGYELTEYADEMFNLSLLSGISDLTTNSNDLYRSMSDGDYFMTMLGLYLNPVYDNKNKPYVLGNYLLPIPSDAPKNFSISSPRYTISKLFIDKTSVNREHILFKQFYNIAMQEVTDMAHAINMLFKCDANGTPIVENGEFVMSDLYNENSDIFYELYFKNKDGEVIGKNSNGNTKLLGNIFNFNRIKSEITPNANKAFANLIGENAPFDFLYGGSRKNEFGDFDYIVYKDNEVKLNHKQRQALEDAVASWILEYASNVANTVQSKYANFYKDVFNTTQNPRSIITEMMFNNYLMNNAMQDLYVGNPAYYKNPQTILKRAKEIQAGGAAFGITDFIDNSLTPRREIDKVMIDNAPLVINGKEIKLYNKYNAVTIYNTKKASNQDTINRIDKQLKDANVDKATRDRLLSPFKGKTATNDAQSYITFEEWVRRITAAGELEKYKSLIKALNDNTPIDQVNWFEFSNRVQVQKNFQFDLYYDPVIGREVPRQVKNAEFVLIPKLIKGTDLERIYNIMVKNNIQQLNTKETVKAAAHNVMTLWNPNTGHLDENKIKEFSNNVSKYTETFSYNYLYRQQEVPQHIEDAANKAAIQIMKKILDNLDPNNKELAVYKQAIINNYVANIRSSYNAVCDELNIKRDEKGNIELDAQGNIPNFNRFVFFNKFKEQAAQQGLDTDIIDYFTVDMYGFNNLPLFMTNINSKLESIVNGYFNSQITRQTISGWHAAQIADFGFNKLGLNKKGQPKEITTSSKLQYKVEKTIDGKVIRHIEIYLPRWSKFLDGMNLNDVPDDIKTMIGYRIPTEGKQSIAIMHVVPYPGTEDGFLPTAYGSSVVVPDQWVTQTGSDFDIDSVYAMSKSFFKIGDKLVAYNNERYSDDIKGYLSYLKDNVDKETRKILGKTYVGRGVLYKITNDTIKNLREAIERKEVETIGVTALNNFAEENGVIKYDQYLKLPKEDRSSQKARANAIIENFINILNHSGAAEESSTTSNFDAIMNDDKTGANDIYAKLVGQSAKVFSPNDPLTMLTWFNDATSGIKLKGISVNRDSFCSICNVTHAQHKTGIRVNYGKDVISKKDAINRFGKDNVDVDGDGNIIITHKNFAWSNDNRNVDGYLITPYSSQTTAHILDVMKSGPIHNENTYTFNAFKTIIDLGSNYDTAVGFMWQPAMDILVEKWKETNSITNNDKNNVLTEAIREIIKRNFNVKDVDKLNRNNLIKIVNELAGKEFQNRFGLSLSDAFSQPNLIFSSADYKSRLQSKENRKSNALFDLYVLAQFNYLNSIGQDVSNNLNVLTADKYGAKQSFYLTDDLIRTAEYTVNNTNIVVNKDGKEVSLLSAVFPGIDKGIKGIIENDVSQSVYPSLAAFMKYSTALSLKVGNAVFDTSHPDFTDKVWALKDYVKRFTEDDYNKYKNYLINSIIVGNDGSPYITMPVTIVDNELVIDKEKIENSALAKNAEFVRVTGSNVKDSTFKASNNRNPNTDDIKVFVELSPAQKLLYVQKVFGKSVFEYISTNVHDNHDNNTGYIIQYLNFNPGNLSNDEIHRKFRQALMSDNALIRLTAVDIVKYAYMIEHNTFRSKNVSRSIGNAALNSYYDGGLSIGTFAQSAMEQFKHNLSTIDKVISYARMNYSTFNCQNCNVIKKAANQSLNIRSINGVLKIGEYGTSAKRILNEILELTADDNNEGFVRFNKTLYLFTVEDNELVFYPLNKLSKFEIADAYESSLLLTNAYKSLGEFKNDIANYNKTRDAVMAYVKDELDNMDLETSQQLPPTGLVAKNDFSIPYFKNGVKHGLTYHDASGNYYVAISGKKAIAISSVLKALKNKYPNANDNEFSLAVRIEPRDVRDKVMYSIIEDSTPVGELLTEAAAKINDAYRHGDKEAAKVMNGMRKAGINILNADAYANNIDFTSGLVGDYIVAEADMILNDINRFIPTNIDTEDNYIPINDDKVIELVLKDYKLQDKFLQTILKARTFADKYRGFNDIDEESLEGNAKKQLKAIQDAIKKVVGNTTVINARKKWLQQFIMNNSNNPNVELGIMNELDAFGDTSFLDYYIQDIRSNKNLIVQNVIKVVDAQIEAARLYGIEEANKFNKQIKDIIEDAKSKGIYVSLNDIIKDGRLIQPNSKSWEETKEKLDTELKVAEEFYGKNSIEWLKAKNNIDSFLAKTTVSKTLPVEVVNEDLKKIKIDYRTQLAYLDYNMLHAENGKYAEVFSKYKQETTKLYTILNSVSNNMTNAEQDKEIDIIYDNINNLTTLYDVDGNPKSGTDKDLAEALRNYISNVKSLKEMFMSKEQKDTFDSKLNNALNIIKRYEIRDNKGRLMSNPAELMNIEEYKQAKEWIKRNTSYILDIKTYEDIRWAFDKIKDPNKKDSYLNEVIKKPNIRDEFGVIDGRLIPQEDVVKIKKELMDSYRYTQRNGLPYGGLIRAVDDDPNVYNYSFFENLRNNKTISQKEIDTSEAINKILEQYFDPETRILMTSAISYEHLVQLKDLFDEYKELIEGNKTGTRNKEIAQFIEKHCETKKADRFDIDHDYASEKGVTYKNAWEQVFGTGLGDDYNRYIYGIIKPKNVQDWIDEEKTQAINILRTRTVEDTTQYYHMMKEEMAKNGTRSEEYRTWWRNNHYYDPYTRTFKPIRIWTTMKFTSDDGNEIIGKFEPKVNQMDIAIKENLVNPEYAKSGINTYKYGSTWKNQSFDNNEYGKLNEYHHQLIDAVKNIMQKFVYTNSDQYFVDKGYLPAIAKGKSMDWKDIARQPLDFVGWTWQSASNTNWINDKDVNYANDYSIPNPMLKTIIDKGAKKLIEIPAKSENQSEEEYREKVNKIKEENAKIKAEAEAYHKDLVNNNWEEVFKAFILNGNRYNTIHTMKSLLYAAENIISETSATEIKSGSPRINRSRSNDEITNYRQEAQTRTSSQLKEYIRRVVFEQYKENPNSNAVKLGMLAQNIAGTKYMMMNITGGIANILTGSSNIMMERLAKQFINVKDWEQGKLEYFKGSVSYLANMYSDSSSTLQDGIIKLSKVVDYDRYVEINNVEGVKLGMKRFRNLMFSPQTATEHFMQNTMLLTMMITHRIKTYPDGHVEIITKERNNRDADRRALLKVISNDEVLNKTWSDFLRNINLDKKLKAEYDLFKRNPVMDFIKQNFNAAQVKEYIKIRKKVIDEANKEFESLPKVYDQFELVDGFARIKTDSKLTKELYAEFIEKVKRVNNKVHGVYDKIGAARIENQWWGSFAMQYHKHLYPGFKKRYRWNGYYNEALDIIEKGSYKSLFDFIMTPLRDVEHGDDVTFASIKGLQNYAISVYQFVRHIQTNWQLLPQYERANMARIWGDVLYVGAAIVGAIALSGLGGDDDDDIIYNLALYHADRLASEAAAFTPIGAFSEFEKLWSSPVAIQQSANDLWNVLNFTIRACVSEDFSSEYTTGRYKGQNKFEVMLMRNIPVVRSVNRLMDLPNNNKYYKLNENMLSVIPYKEWGDAIFK